ncbi:hypothetical protein ACEXQD_18305 [Herbiconiux sp. P15]|uniref:hypothetical protein n=1 Tax=Herbiconiux liukaitaii TaxID=3342799 RepID=UPI0035BB18F3
MTIALVLKVNDGIVLASDSATSMIVSDASGNGGVANVYNNANKVFNLHKGLPIGAMTWGLGNIGTSSISTIAKGIREGFHEDVDEKNYLIDDIAKRVHKELVSNRYDVRFPHSGPRPAMGFLVAGYSSHDDQAHLYVLQAADGADGTPEEILSGEEDGASWWGQPEAISRILNGFSNDTVQAVVNMGVGDQAQAVQFVQELERQVAAQLVHPAMPIQDAIDLAEFLVHATIQYVRFQPGAPTVGGPIEIATITKHEGFKWVARKHYFDRQLNPGRD